MTVLELRSRIETLLSGLIGTYTHIDDAGVEVGTSPALTVETAAGNAPNSNVKVSGLEVVIRPELEMPLTPLIGTTLSDTVWQIVLKQWDISGDTIAATKRLVAGLPEIVTIEPRITRNSELDNIETRTLVLEFPEILNLKTD